ncbi:MAG: transporter substrate-binding domain-containing protein [Candidatus Sedimenticola sp. (ex Thyasira tokunagai)]
MNKLALQLIAFAALILSGLSTSLAQTDSAISLTQEEQAWLDANHTVRVRVTHWPPYTFNSPEVEGVSIDYWEQFAELFGIDSEYWITDMPFAESFKDLTGENEYYDLHLTLTRTPDRIKKLAMTRHYFSAPWVIIASKDREDISTIEDLNGKLVAIERGYALVDLIEKNFPNIKLEFYGTTEEAIDSVAVNETAAYIGNIARSLYHINQNSLINLQVVGRTPFGRHQQAIAVRKDWAPLATLFDKWLKTLSSAERNAILGKWVAGYEGPKSKLEKKIALNEEEHAWIAAHPTVVARVSEYPPFHFTDGGKPVGYSIDLMNRIAALAGFDVHYVSGMPWSEGLEHVRQQDGEVDILLTALNTPERRGFMAFTRDYLELPFRIIARADDDSIRNMDDLAGKTVAIEKGFAVVKMIRDAYPDIEVMEVDGHAPAALRLVSLGDADAYIGNQPVTNYHIVNLGIIDLKVAGPTPFGFQTQALGLRKDWPELASILDKTLAAISLEELEVLQRRWGLRELPRDKTGAVIALTEEERSWLENNHITLSVDDRYAPMNFRDTDGKMTGLSIDYIRMIEKKLGISINLDTRPWPQALANALEHKTDGIINAKSTPDRAEKLHFTSPFIEAPMALFTRTEAPIYQSIEELNGKRVLVKKKTAEATLLPKNYPSVEIIEVDSYKEALSLLSTGRADALFGHLIVVDYEREKNYFANIMVNYLTFDEIVTAQRIGVRNDSPLLISVLNKTILAITEEEHRSIRTKWVSTPLEKETPTIKLTSEERAWIEANPKIRIHNETEWPPFNYAENGQPKGFSIDFMNLVAKNTGLEVEYVTGPTWNEFLEMMKRGELDVMLNIVKTPERLKYLLYTPSYADNPNVILSKKDKPYNSVESLFGKTVATPKGFFTEEILKREYPQITVLPLKNMLESMKAVSFGQADAALGELAVFNHLLNKHMMTDLTVIGEADLGDPELSLLHIATRKEHPVLSSILTKGVEAVTQEEKSALLAKWLMQEKEGPTIKLTAEEQAWINSHPVIKVSNEMDWRPFDFNENGKPSGYSIDLIKLLAERIGIQLEFVHGPTWEEFLESLKEKKIDVIHSAIKTEDREKYSLFTDPYIQTISRFIVHKDSSEIRELSDLKGKIFAAPKGWATLEYLEKNRPDIKLLETESLYDAFNAVMLGKADATAERDKVAKHYISYYGLSDLKVSSWFREFDQNKATGLHAMVRDDWPILKDLLDKALASLTIEEKLALESRWFGEVPVVDEDAQILSQDIVFNQAALLIKWVAISFAILVLLMVVYWFAKGRPTQFSIRLTLLFISTIFAGLIVAIGLLVLMLLRGELRQEEIENNRYESIQLAYELKQSSDDLTRFARTYVVTGDPKYEEYFQAIIDIRDGKLAHPKGYSHIYWDQVSAGLVEHNTEGETYSLEQRMVELGMSDQEIGMLRQSKYASDELISLEDVAMNMVRGVYYKDDENRFTVKTKPNMALARALLHGEKYHAAKANIMRPINEVFVLLKKRTEKELETERANNKAILLVIVGLIIVIIVFSAYTYMFFRRRMVKPLEVLKGGALKIEGGDYQHQIAVDSKDEMGDLGRAFNAMADGVHHRTQDLRSAMEQLELALSAADAGTFIHDYEHDVVKLDQRACHHFGIQQNEITFNQFFENIHPEDVPDVSQLLKGALSIQQEYITVEFRASGEGHENKQIQVQALIQYSSKTGKPKRSIGIVFDITERKEAEEELFLLNELLNSSLKSGNIGAFSIDLYGQGIEDLVIKSHDENFGNLLGLSPLDGTKTDYRLNEFRENSRRLVEFHPEFKDVFDKINQTHADCIAGVIDGYEHEYPVLSQDGETLRWINSRAEILKRKADGSALLMTGAVIDVTERKKAEEEIQAAKDQAEAANKSKSAFLASMSHELRTPLNAVLGFSQLMHGDKTLNEQQRGNLNIINNSGKHLLQLINDVLDMSKIEAGKIDLMPEDIDLGALVSDVLEMLQVRAGQKGLELILDQSPDVPRVVYADGPKIRQLLINLLNNAIKFTDVGSVTLRLSAKGIESQSITLYGEIEDTGRGIAPEDVERVFQPFEQLAAAVEQKGTGLGLAITRQFVEMMGGDISATSEQGKGSVFRFHIQVEPGNQELVMEKEKLVTRQVIGLRGAGREWRILIAEDELVNQLLLKELLEKVGFQVRIVDDGEKAVDLFQEWRPHFIWMDRRMPRMDGLEATRRIRQLPGGQEVKIASLTADVFKEQEEEVLAAGSDDFLGKPYLPGDMYDCMARHLGLEYAYEEEASEASPESEDIASITPERIAALPAEVREALGKAATRLDIDQAGAVLKQIEEVDPELAAALGQLVDHLDFYAIKRLLSQ